MRMTTGLMLIAALPAIGSVAPAQSPQPAVRLITLPTKIYFTSSNSKERQEGSILFLIVETNGDLPMQPDMLDLTYRRGSTVLRTERLTAPVLEKIDVTEIPPTRLYPSAEAAKRRWPHSYRLALAIPAELGADQLEARLSWPADGTRSATIASLPIQSYDQKTALIFPFKGPGIINVAGALFSGHRNRSGLYAIDALGLNATYGPMVRSAGDDQPANYAGWGREIIAPAAGTVVVAKNDHVDQPVAGTSDATYFLPEYKNGGDPGNHIIIDHGNGEFSMIAHLRQNSVRVKVGDKVAQGEVLGLMGNSGDSSGPHVHYQLQDGPDWERSDALPFRFTNVRSLTPGSYFSAN